MAWEIVKWSIVHEYQGVTDIGNDFAHRNTENAVRDNVKSLLPFIGTESLGENMVTAQLHEKLSIPL